MNNFYLPMVIEQENDYERSYDIYSRLLKDRIIFVGNEITEDLSNAVVAQLLFLEYDNPEEDITMYINSPGGIVTGGLAVIDTMNFITSDVSTICMGQACSMASLFLSAGARGKRFALPNSRIMIHQPLGGMSGQASDIEIHAKEIIRVKKILNEMLAENTGQSVEKIESDTDRDNFLNPYTAKEYGLIDEVIEKR